MQVFLIEIRDAGTFIPAMAVVATVADGPEHYLLHRAGWPEGRRVVWLTRLSDGETTTDPIKWGRGTRTMTVAHLALYGFENCWHEWRDEILWDRVPDLRNGAVIDVEHLLGLRDQPKQSEALELGHVGVDTPASLGTPRRRLTGPFEGLDEK